MSNVQIATDDDFGATVEAASGPVLVDFHAAWCAPCKAMAPALEAFAAENPGVRVVKVDIEDAFDVARRLGVRGVPTLMVFNEGQVLRSRSGAMSKEQLAAFVG